MPHATSVTGTGVGDARAGRRLARRDRPARGPGARLRPVATGPAHRPHRRRRLPPRPPRPVHRRAGGGRQRLGDPRPRHARATTPRCATRSPPQDGLYTLIEREDDRATPRVIGSLVDYAFTAGRPDATVEILADPQVAIVSMTITEAGYARGRARRHRVRPHRRRARAPPRRRQPAADDPQLRQPARQRRRRAGRHARRGTTAGRRARRTGSRPRARSRTRWSTGSRRPPPTTTGRGSLASTASSIAGRSSPSRSASGSSRTASRTAGRAGKPSAPCSPTTSSRGSCTSSGCSTPRHSSMAYLCALAGITFVDEAMATPAVRGFLETPAPTRGDPVAAPDPRQPAGGLRDDGPAPVLEHGRARPDRPAVHRRRVEVSDVPRADDRASARRRRPDRVRARSPSPAGRATSGPWTRPSRRPTPPPALRAHLAAEARTEPARFLELDGVMTPSLREQQPVPVRVRGRLSGRGRPRPAGGDGGARPA